MADKPAARPGKAEFSIDDFIGEIEKHEDSISAKPLYAERMRNKRALDRADQAAAAAEDEAKAKAAREAAKPKTALEKRRTTKSSHDTVTGMSAKSPKSKANSVERPTNLDGFGESEQAGFGHMPSAATRSAQTENAGTELRQVVAKTKKSRGAPKIAGSTLDDSGTVGVTATVKALEQIILHGRKEVEGSSPWAPHRPTRPVREASRDRKSVV